MSTAILAQFNKYPFFLFLTYSKEARLDLEKMEVHTVIEDQEYNSDTKQMETVAIKRMSRIEAVPTWQVVLMKYMPILFLLYWSNYPNSKAELYVALISLAYFSAFVGVFNYNRTLAKYIGILSIVALYFVRFKLHVNAIHINWFLGYFMTYTMAFYLIYDLYKKRYRNYYNLLDLGGTKRIQLATRQKRPLIMIPFMRKMTGGRKAGILHVNQGFNLGFNVFLRGYFVRIVKEIKEEVTADETNV